LVESNTGGLKFLRGQKFKSDSNRKRFKNSQDRERDLMDADAEDNLNVSGWENMNMGLGSNSMPATPDPRSNQASSNPSFVLQPSQSNATENLLEQIPSLSLHSDEVQSKTPYSNYYNNFNQRLPGKNLSDVSQGGQSILTDYEKFPTETDQHNFSNFVNHSSFKQTKCVENQIASIKKQMTQLDLEDQIRMCQGIFNVKRNSCLTKTIGQNSKKNSTNACIAPSRVLARENRLNTENCYPRITPNQSNSQFYASRAGAELRVTNPDNTILTSEAMESNDSQFDLDYHPQYNSNINRLFLQKPKSTNDHFLCQSTGLDSAQDENFQRLSFGLLGLDQNQPAYRQHQCMPKASNQ
jgi:hypothetical protein